MAGINDILQAQYRRSLRLAEQARHKAERIRNNNKLQDKDKELILQMFRSGSRPNHISKKLGLTKELIDSCIREYMTQEEKKFEAAANNT